MTVTARTTNKMKAVRQKNTGAEVATRQLLHGLGLRFRLHRKDLPGSPDIVLPRHETIIFVHGCYWHRHGCKATTTPKRNRAFWEAKFARNVERDAESAAALRKLGFTVVVVWECETKGDLAALRERLHSELNQA